MGLFTPTDRQIQNSNQSQVLGVVSTSQSFFWGFPGGGAHNALTGLVRVGVLCFVNIYNGVDITQSYPVVFFYFSLLGVGVYSY